MSQQTDAERELLYKAVYEKMAPSDEKLWGSTFSDKEIAAFKIETGRKFFSEQGNRILLSEKEWEEVAAFLLQLFQQPEQLEQYLRAFTPPSSCARFWRRSAGVG